METFDLCVIGAGPTGMACAIEAQRAGFRAVLIEKGCLVNSIFHYPANMVFFTTPELLEIGDIPFPSAHQKPNRQEALEYYRNVAEHYELDVRQYQRGDEDLGKRRRLRHQHQDTHKRKPRIPRAQDVLATGYYDRPNIHERARRRPAEGLHYYQEPHPFYDTRRADRRRKEFRRHCCPGTMASRRTVTMVHRGPGIHDNVKYWIKPDIENRIKAGQVNAYFNSRVKEIALKTTSPPNPERGSAAGERFRLRTHRLSS